MASEQAQPKDDAAPNKDNKNTDFERAKIEAALKVIPSDSYQIWFEVGAALFNAMGDEGFALFDRWSAKSPKYNQSECRKQWQHCGEVEKFTVATIFHHANATNPNWRQEFEAKHGKPLILTSREFVAGFVPPDYLIDGILQRGFLYSMTAPTNTGKTAIALRLAAHISIGSSLGEREVLQGKVLYFAGENPDEIRTRWMKLTEEMKIDPNSADVFFVAG